MNFYKMISVGLSLLNIAVFAGEIERKVDQWDGSLYIENSELQYKWATNCIQKLGLKGQERVLDIGCGDGRISALMAYLLPEGYVKGIDNSDSMLQAAQNLQNKICLNNLEFIKQNAISLNFENEFDVVVSFSCFHWISDHYLALQSIQKALKPGGKVFLYFAHDYENDRIDQSIDAIVGSQKWSPYFSNYSAPYFIVPATKFIQQAISVGLDVKQSEFVTITETFADRFAFATWMSGWMSQLNHLPKELHQAFLVDIVDDYLRRRSPNIDNTVNYVGYWIEIEFTKPSFDL